MRRILLQSLGVFVLASLLMVPAALAQGQQPQQQPPPQQQQQAAPDVDVDDDELQTVAEVYVEIEQIRESYRPQFQSMEDPQEAQQLQQELSQEVDQAIEQKEGITMERYEEIIQAAQVDDALRNELLATIESVRGGSPN